MRKRELPRVLSPPCPSGFTPPPPPPPPLALFSLRAERRGRGATRRSSAAPVILPDDDDDDDDSARVSLLHDFPQRLRAVATRFARRIMRDELLRSRITRVYAVRPSRPLDDTGLCAFAPRAPGPPTSLSPVPPLCRPPSAAAIAVSLSRTTPSVFVLIIIHHATSSNGCATSFISRLLLVRAIVKSLDRLLARRFRRGSFREI
jgi:hypothetical protein